MKKILLLTALTILITTPFAFCAKDQTPGPEAISVREMTNAQLYRYGRELYRKGDLAGAANVFKHILTIDCRNKLAQYHLQMIAAKGGAFKDAADFLNNLPCDSYNFSNEDFLPASLFYEKDADLVLEQAAAYNHRYRAAKATLDGQITQYAKMVEFLGGKVQTLQDDLKTAKDNATDTASLQKQLEESRTLAARMNADAGRLKEELAASRATQRKESEAFMAKLAGMATAAAPSTPSPAVQETRTRLVQREKELTDKTRELETLQQKFAFVLERLAQIETSLAERNARLQGLNSDLNNIKK